MNLLVILDKMPTWGVALGSLVITFTSLEIGYRLGERWRRKQGEDADLAIGPVVSASFSLLAFMLAMVFGSVVSRHKEIKHGVLDEANVIRTAFYRVDLLPEANRPEMRRLLSDYVDSRNEAARSESDADSERALTKSEGIQDELWSGAVAIADQHATSTTSLYLRSLNDLISQHEKWIALAVHQRLPEKIWVLLYGVAILVMLVGGYNMAVSGNRRVDPITFTAALAFSLVFALAISLDRPHEHLASTAASALTDLQEDIRRAMEKD